MYGPWASGLGKRPCLAVSLVRQGLSRPGGTSLGAVCSPQASRRGVVGGLAAVSTLSSRLEDVELARDQAQEMIPKSDSEASESTLSSRQEDSKSASEASESTLSC